MDGGIEDGVCEAPRTRSRSHLNGRSLGTMRPYRPMNNGNCSVDEPGALCTLSVGYSEHIRTTGQVQATKVGASVRCGRSIL